MFESEPLVRIMAEIEGEQRALTNLIAQLALGQLSRRVLGQWTPVDTLNHVTAWQNNALTIARQQAQADAPDLDPAAGVGTILGLPTERFNQELLLSHADWSVEQALAWQVRVNGDLRKALVVLPPARLLGGPGPHGARIWYSRPGIIHPRLHRLELAKGLGLG